MSDNAYFRLNLKKTPPLHANPNRIYGYNLNDIILLVLVIDAIFYVILCIKQK